MVWFCGRRHAASFCVIPLVVLVGGCTGATVGSGVGDTWLGQAPYYSGRPVPAGTVAYVPVTFQAGAAGPASFDLSSEPDSPVAELLRVMNAHLDSLAVDRLLRRIEPVAGTPPDVHFGCEPGAWDECVFTDDDGDGDPEMRLAVGRPSRQWIDAAAAQLTEAEADALLVLTLETGWYWPRQTNWRGGKAVDLGTGRTVALPWLTSLEDPVSVIQITGSLVRPDGRAIAAGAEGLVARRTSILLTGFDVHALVSDEDAETLLTVRVDDRGATLVWQQAIDDLVDRLTGSSSRTAAAIDRSPGS
ncbi:MAG: hypothetical protein R3314_11185 [Longimicrobiales bacterium]|nr:hypothetical protein [Longimicrobiales bacterium]